MKTEAAINTDPQLARELLLYSNQKSSLRIKVQEPAGKTSWMVGKAHEIHLVNRIHYLQFEDGRKVRLDQILDLIPSH